MEDEFDKIMRFFDLDPDEKAAHLKDVFDDSIAFFEKFKHMLQHGTLEEKQEMIKKAAAMQEKLQNETQKICSETGLNEEELKKYAQTKENFTEEDWEAMETTKSKIEEEAQEIHSMVNFTDKTPPPSKPKKKKPRGPKRTGWVRS